MIPPLGVIATGAEILFGVLLLVGWHTRATALLTGLLLLSFGVAMTLALGVKAPLNFAVFTGVGGACFSQIAKASHLAWMSYCSVEPSRGGQMKAARVLRLGSQNVITNDDLPQPESFKKKSRSLQRQKQHAAGSRQIVFARPAFTIVNETRSNT